MKYKQLRDLPDEKEGSIWELKNGKYVCGDKSYPLHIVENNPKWFFKISFTSTDGVNMIEGDIFWYFNKDYIVCNKFYDISYKDVDLKFSTRIAALKYKAKEKYPVGSSFKCLDSGEKVQIDDVNEFYILEEYYDNTLYYKKNKVHRDGEWAEMIPKFEVGKWYNYKNKYFLKYTHSEDKVYAVGLYGEAINPDGYRKSSYWANREMEKDCVLLKDLSIIQKYLPNDHVDKIVSWKVGDIIAVKGKDIVAKITKIEDYHVSTDCTKKIDYRFLGIREATKDEIRKYYESLGWVKGAKFKAPKPYPFTGEFENIVFREGFVGLYLTANSYLKLGFFDYVKWNIDDCELIKEPNYPKNWEDLKSISGFYIGGMSNIEECEKIQIEFHNQNVYVTKSQAKSVLAFAQLSQLHKAMIDEYNRVNNCDWKPDYTDITKHKYYVNNYENQMRVSYTIRTCRPLTFPIKEMAEFSLEHHRELWQEYYES